MTGPTVYSKAINIIHHEIFNENINHENIQNNTDITYKSKNISYRIYGIDYNEYFRFKHKFTKLLYNNKKHWRQEQRQKSLLI